MTERKPRIAVTLSEDTRVLVQRLAEFEGSNPSKVVAGIVEEFAPIMRQMVEAFDAVADAPAEKRARVAALAEQMEAEVLGKTDAAHAAFTDVLDQAKKAVL